jgi:hypothetical protein
VKANPFPGARSCPRSSAESGGVGDQFRDLFVPDGPFGRAASAVLSRGGIRSLPRQLGSADIKVVSL